MNPDDDIPFCDITKIAFCLPPDLIDMIHKNRSIGTRKNIPYQRAGRTITSQYLVEMYPGIERVYNDLKETVREKLRMDVSMVSTDDPLSMCVINYDHEGDHISWHYDENVYKGRFFTVIVPVTFEETCTHFEFMNEKGCPQEVALNPGEALLFEGPKVRHRATPLCKDQTRIIMSFKFATDTSIVSPFLSKFKELFF